MDQDVSKSTSEFGAEEGKAARQPIESLSLLTRREIEALIVSPIVDEFVQEFGRDRVLGLLGTAIERIAQEQGARLAEVAGGRSLQLFARALEMWKRDDALRIEMLEQTENRLFFNVVRCRYAELYRRLGMAELGSLLSCNRDFALIKGFNPDVVLTRTQTIMDGARYCDFRFTTQGEHRSSGEGDR
jgi:hypothetical protein